MKWSLNDLMPICLVPTCRYYHSRHMLEHQAEIATQILTGDEVYIYWQGGVGSAKTVLWAALAAAYMIIIPGSRIILCRRDFALLYDTLWRFFKDSIKAATDKGIIQGNYDKFWTGRSLKATAYCELPNGSWARSVQLKNWTEAMGPTYDAIFISDAMENQNFGEIFHGEGVVGGLQSRLRGQRSTFFQLPDGVSKDMRRFLIETNPPPNINELHTLFGREPGVRTLPGIDVTYRHIQSSTIQNDHNPPTYLAEIASMHSNKGDVQRILEGKTVPYYGGVRVIETFYPELHVNEFTVDSTLPLFVGIDPGYQHPSVVFSQIRRCDYGNEHIITLSEISNLFNVTTWDLVTKDEGPLKGILAHLGTYYSDYFDYQAYLQIRGNMKDHIQSGILAQHFFNIRFCIDKDANKISRQTKDRSSDHSILANEFGIQCKSRNNIGVDKSLDRTRQLYKEVCVCNVPRKMVDRKCELLIDAYSGGYRYEKKKDGSHTDIPLDDHMYKDVCDADRYFIENFYWQTVHESTVQPHVVSDPFPWSWMERR